MILNVVEMENQIKNYLSQKFISVPDEWIPACIDFIKSEHASSNHNVNNALWLRERVFEQWLHADITELGVSCLPFSLSKQKSTTIKGEFILQVNHIKDIGLPAYSQLQKLCKDDNQNASISADKSFAAAWEPKPSRMLLLQMTDGTSMIQGMEYKSINCLSLSMKPGVKILLKGTIEVRRGILLLKKEHVTVLGGEVESLAVSNAPENIMRRALRMEDADEPTAIPEAFTPDVSMVGEPSQYYNTQSTQNSFHSNSNSNSNNTINTNNKNNMRNHVRITPTPQPSSTPLNSNQLDDPFEDFMDDEDMAFIEAEQKASAEFSASRKTLSVQPQQRSFKQSQSASRVQSSTNNYRMGNSSYGDSQPASSFSGSSFQTSQLGSGNRFASSTQNASQISTLDAQLFEDDDDELLLAAAEIPFKTPDTITFNSDSNSKKNSPFNSLLQQQKSSFQPQNSSFQPKKSSFQPKNSSFQPQNSSFQPQNSSFQPQNSSFQPQNSSFQPQNSSFRPQNSSFQPQNSSFQPQNSSFQPQNSSFQPQNSSFQPQNSSFQSKNSSFQPQNSFAKPSFTPPFTSTKPRTDIKMFDSKEQKNDFPTREQPLPRSAIVSPFPETNSGTKKPFAITKAQNNSKIQSKLSKYMFEKRVKIEEANLDTENSIDVSITKKSVKERIGNSPPYQYICFMDLSPTQKICYTIKGFVTTLLSKLEQKEGKWNLTAKINDGTGACDVDIDDQVLRKLIGMSVEEFRIEKEKVNSDPQLRNSLGQRVCRCQIELIRMVCLLRIEAHPSTPRPRVLELLSLTDNHLQQMKQRGADL